MKIKEDKKKILILLCGIFIICGTALGYAALSSTLKISGMGTISTSWDILFTSIEEKGSKGATSNESVVTDKLTATFDVDIDAPGNYIEYNVTLKNNGNIDAVIESIEGIVEANTKEPTGIQFKVSGIRIGDDLFAGDEKTFVVRAEIPSSETTLPSGTKTLNLKVNVRQKDIDSSGLVTTFKDCFQTNEVGDTITKYLCGKENTNGYSEILDVTIPSEIDGHTITQIGAGSFAMQSLTSVNIPNTITAIGDNAFSYNELTTIEFPNSLKKIGYNAFIYNLLSKIVIPDGVTSIGNTAFRDNQMPDAEAFIYNRNSDGTENKESINSYAGRNRNRVVVPNGVKIIGSYAFNALGLQTVVLPDGIENIEAYAFRNNKLTSLILPNSVKYVRDQAFYNNTLTELVIPSNTIFLGSSAFGKNKLSQVVFMGNVPTTVKNNIFGENPDLQVHTIQVPIGTLQSYKTVQALAGDGPLSPSQTWFGSDDSSLLDAFYE